VIAVGGRNGEPIDFVLAIPGKITRRYHGTLEIKTDSESLIPTVSMDLEIAVASVVAAESAPDTPVEALKAQAIATRSYFVSGRGRHRDFDFCDTTHCQFLREPSPAGSKVMQAVIETRQMILAYNSKPFAAVYTRSCAGRTRTPAQLGLSPVSYPYYSVDCPFCRSHPARWTTRISLADAAALRSSDESSRLNLGRLLGWNAVPSNDFVLKLDGNEVILQGTGNGHGIGLCQSGSKAMAEAGSNFREILAHYYPNATVIILPGADSAGAYAGF
jgi:stage II sporulation protein D